MNDNVTKINSDLNGKMTDNQVDKLYEVLTNNTPQEVLEMQKSFENANNSKDANESNIANVTSSAGGPTSNVTDESVFYDGLKNNNTLDVKDINDGKLEDVNNEISKNIVKEFYDAVYNNKESSETPEGNTIENSVSDEDAFSIIQSIQEYQRGVKKNYYNSMPQKMKETINSMIIQMGHMPTMDLRNRVAKDMLSQFISEIDMNKEFIDFENTMKNTLSLPSIPDIYSDYIREMMEEKTLDMADKIQEESPEKAELLRKVSAAFTSSYTFDKLYDCLVNNRKARNHITKDRKDYNKFLKDFNYLSENSKFKINDIFMAGNTLSDMVEDNFLEGYTLDDVSNFMILLCKTCENMDRNDIIDCAFIYHAVKNIIMLDYRSGTLTDFSEKIIENIKLLMNAIRSREEAHNNEVAAMKKNKKGGK